MHGLKSYKSTMMRNENVDGQKQKIFQTREMAKIK